MRLRSLFGLLVLMGSLAACATGGKFAGTGAGSSEGGTGGGNDGGGTASTSESMAGGGGGTPTGSTGQTTTGETTGSTSSTSSTTTTTPPCEDDPCKLVVPQCGCPDGQMCAINTAGDRVCHAPGAVPIGEVCTGFYSCTTGSLCVMTSTDPNTSLCARYCDLDSQCGGGGAICLLELNDPSSPGQVLPDIKLCTDDCSPISNSGCPAGSGLGCQVYQEAEGQMRFFTLCSGAGTGTQGATCVDNEDCAPGHSCFTFADGTVQCLQRCDVDNPACALCVSINPPQIYDGINYGACL